MTNNVTNTNITDTRIFFNILGDPTTLLFEACQKKDTKRAEELLEQGANPNALNSSKESPLVVACQENDLDMIKLLLKYEADPNAYSDDQGHTLLMKAILEDKYEIAEFLGKYGADIRRADKSGNTAIHLAAQKNQDRLLFILVQEAGTWDTPLFKENSLGDTPLMCACKAGSLKTAKMLLKYFGSGLNDQNLEGQNILHIAYKTTNIELIDLIFDKCFFPTETTKEGQKNRVPFETCLFEDNYGKTPFAYAVNKPELFILLRELYGQAKTVGCPMLIAACANGDLKLAKYLIEGHPDLVTEYDKKGFNAFHWACSEGHLEVVKYILEQKKEVLALKTLQRDTPLEVALKGGKDGIAKLLIENDAEISDTARDIACQKKFQNIVELIDSKKTPLEEPSEQVAKKSKK